MGECFISRRGGGEAYKLPILDTNYPQDITVMATPDGTASFSIAIAEHGKPTNYTYQWYVNGEAVSGAINANYSMNTTVNDIGTYTVYCDITSKAGTISSRIATLAVKSAIPTTYSYSGLSELKKESNYDWTLYLKSSGVLVLDNDYNVDIFVQAGGGGGATGGDNGGGGGAGGYQDTQYAQTINSGSYDITIGAGGAAGSKGGDSTAFGFTANGGSNGSGMNGGSSGTARGGNGGYYNDGMNLGGPGSNGANGKQAFGVGDIYYGAGGGGAASKFESSQGAGGKTGGGNADGGSGTANTGSGGGGGRINSAGSGGSGIVIIRNAR